ncbi:P-loop containing nucleoside triphosphate hydrolase protein [Gymnopus androsaceus JB14]|uniref:P-loop containing nucleoside triphosphate hydrolase protein n=1 Tax=Gymnopus androsaceus JB14 TaxID=1447944 RepID=A0A6A4HEE8_9AGAR|nr:P-loop containing nucleoside triphosphate hydrolase protein [Gymnopus androsaceus JB14]
MSTDVQELFTVRELGCKTEDGTQIFSDVELTLNEGDIVVVLGKSGCGKTTFLKCLAHLNLYTGHIMLHGKTPKSYGVPIYRTKVAYIPQRPPLLPGTPRDFLSAASSFKARRKKVNASMSAEGSEHAIGIASSWGVDTQLWDRDWSNLSGGETQRIALAIGVGLDTAEVLLLDEPTSALDNESYVLKSSESLLKAIVWITHSPEQASRVGTRFLQFADGGSYEESIPPV